MGAKLACQSAQNQTPNNNQTRPTPVSTNKRSNINHVHVTESELIKHGKIVSRPLHRHDAVYLLYPSPSNPNAINIDSYDLNQHTLSQQLTNISVDGNTDDISYCIHRTVGAIYVLRQNQLTKINLDDGKVSERKSQHIDNNNNTPICASHDGKMILFGASENDVDTESKSESATQSIPHDKGMNKFGKNTQILHTEKYTLLLGGETCDDRRIRFCPTAAIWKYNHSHSGNRSQWEGPYCLPEAMHSFGLIHLEYSEYRYIVVFGGTRLVQSANDMCSKQMRSIFVLYLNKKYEDDRNANKADDKCHGQWFELNYKLPERANYYAVYDVAEQTEKVIHHYKIAVSHLEEILMKKEYQVYKSWTEKGKSGIVFPAQFASQHVHEISTISKLKQNTRSKQIQHDKHDDRPLAVEDVKDEDVASNLDPNILDIIQKEVDDVMNANTRTKDDKSKKCPNGTGHGNGRNSSTASNQATNSSNTGNTSNGTISGYSSNSSSGGGSVGGGGGRKRDDDDEKKRDDHRKHLLHTDDYDQEEDEEEDEEDEDEESKEGETMHKLNVNAMPFTPSLKSKRNQTIFVPLSQFTLDTIAEGDMFVSMSTPNLCSDRHAKRKKSTATLSTMTTTKGKKKNPPRYTFGYEPCMKYRAKSNILISRKLTKTIIPRQIKERVHDLFAYMDKTTALQYNSTSNAVLSSSTLKIIDYDFHDRETDEVLYGVVECVDNNTWSMKERLYSSTDLMTEYQINDEQLPQSERLSTNFTLQLSRMGRVKNLILNKKEITNFIRKTKWNKIQIAKRKQNRRRMTLSLDVQEFTKDLLHFVRNEKEKIVLIPILVFNENHSENVSADQMYRIEYVWIVCIAKNIHIGISFIIDMTTSNENIRVTAIHLDQEYLMMAHHLVLPQHGECGCLAAFETNIDDLNIGHPDDDMTTIKCLRHELKNRNAELSTLRKDVRRMHSLQEENEKLKIALMAFQGGDMLSK